MNANLFSKMKNIFVILFILSLSFPIKAQDTIKFNTGTKYYWNNELTNSDSTKRQLAVSTLGYGPYDTEKKCARWKAIAFPPNTEKMVYGIAGTTILCENPKGCFFYLMKKVNINDTIRYEIIESAEWNNNSFAGYIDYNIDTSFTPTLDYPASLYRNQIFHDGDSSVQKVYEVYFSTPRALTDTFYIGMSTNLYIPYPNQFYSNDHTVIVGYLPIPWDERYYSRWLLYDPEIDVCQDIRSPYHGGLFAIVEPDSNVCPNVNNVWVENVDTNSAVVKWGRPYIATYYNVEYGVEGFATPKHLVKEDGSQAQLEEKLQFKVIEFNKESKRIILSHSRIAEDATKAEARKAAPKKVAKKEKEEENAVPAIEKTTLGDLDALQALKEQLSKSEK